MSFKSEAQFKISTFQKQVYKYDETINLFLGGGRGGAKTYLAAILAVTHCLKYGSKSNVVYIREYVESLNQFRDSIFDICKQIATKITFPISGKTVDFVTYNIQDKLFKFFNGSKLKLAQLRDDEDYSKLHGRSYSLIIVDEICEFSEEQFLNLLDKLRTCLRGDKSVPRRLIYLANPGGPSHYLVYTRYVENREPWEVFDDPATIDQALVDELKLKDKIVTRRWVYCPSTYKDNPFIDTATYVDDLLRSSSEDPELVKAWVAGSWSINRGSFFDDKILDPLLGGRNKIYNWKYLYEDVDFRNSKELKKWDFMLAHDYGTAAPSVTYVIAQSDGAFGPDGNYYPQGSLVVVDEYATNVPGSTTVGLRLNVIELAPKIKELGERWDMVGRAKLRGPADSQMWALDGRPGGTVANEFYQLGVNFQKVEKGPNSRPPGWVKMKKMMMNSRVLSNSPTSTDKPGLYICERCKYFWNTLGKLQWNPKKDGDCIGADHAADAIRYAIVYTNSGEDINKPLAQEFRLWG